MAVAPFVRAYEKYDHFPLNSSSIQSLRQSAIRPLSWAINQGAGISFCDYINQLLLAEAQRRLQQPLKNLFWRLLSPQVLIPNPLSIRYSNPVPD
ncbi:MAG: hypothetical protein U5K38_05785 [Woeseiaceae bacterium]|nr:hypothetical protein [Woeseiaceae bacterium]